MIDTLKVCARALKNEITALYYAGRSPSTPPLAKLLVIITVGYALSPIDLIPDFIPILGYLDDLIILPALIFLAIKLIPPDVMSESRLLAKEKPISLPRNWVAAIFFILTWALILTVLVLGVLKAFETT